MAKHQVLWEIAWPWQSTSSFKRTLKHQRRPHNGTTELHIDFLCKNFGMGPCPNHFQHHNMLQLYIYIPIHYPYFHPAMATCVALVEFLEAGGKTTGCLVVPLIIPLLCYLGMVNFGEIHQVLVRPFLADMSIMYQDLHLGTSTKKRVYCIHQKCQMSEPGFRLASIQWKSRPNTWSLWLPWFLFWHGFGPPEAPESNG